QMIAGFVEPSGGSIVLDGKDVSRTPANKRGLGMVFQNYALFPHMTVFENVAYGLKIRKFSKDEIKKRVDAAAQILELSHL
ncbi:ATP-binding cassette domain-containing protein, partial [Campylobacter jejuni]|nr:ATP-binding cassette domain-containing protein [Campylobacter jejuni]